MEESKEEIKENTEKEGLDCPNDCSNKGTCIRTTGICQCNLGNSGADCSGTYLHLDNYYKYLVCFISNAVKN